MTLVEMKWDWNNDFGKNIKQRSSFLNEQHMSYMLITQQAQQAQPQTASTSELARHVPCASPFSAVPSRLHPNAPPPRP
jgi:hypothetical protein